MTTDTAKHTPAPHLTREICLAGGCFWGMQAFLDRLPGVVSTRVGFANSTVADPTYELVCTGTTSAAEAVMVRYQPEVLPLDELIRAFFFAIDPTTLNRQGADRGTQYRSGVYPLTADEIPQIRAVFDEEATHYDFPIVTELSVLENFFEAEEYHQDYLAKNPRGYCHINPLSADRFARAHKLGVYGVSINPEDYSVISDDAIKETYGQSAYEVVRHAATDRPGTHPYTHVPETEGIYVDITSGEPLFSTREQFESGCGWPSFGAPLRPEVIRESEDTSFGMYRTEVRSRVGDAHLGHVFEDGPARFGGTRYCINGSALRFIPKDKMAQAGYGDLLGMFPDAID